MNKKGIFLPTFALLLIVVVTYSILMMVSEDNDLNKSKDIGFLQNDVYNLYNNANNEELYLTVKSDYVLDKSTLEFTKIAWFYQSELDVINFNIDLKSKFLTLFNEKFAEPDTSVSILNSKLVINSKKNYNNKSNDYSINYNPNITITKSLNFPLDKFILLKEEIASKYSCLGKAKDGAEAGLCIDNQGLNLKIEKNGNMLSFEIQNNKEIYTLENNNLKEVKPVFTFTLDLNKASTF